MAKVSEIYDFLCKLAPLELQMSFDNSGMQLGRKTADVSKCLIALDVTEDVVNEAIENECQLIISHHPLIFHALKSICDEKILRLIEYRIAVISMHTNLDIADGGVNDALIKALGLSLESDLDENGCGRIGCLENPMSFDMFLQHCKAVLGTKGLRYYDCGRQVSKVAVMGGAGGGEVYTAASKGCDVYLTSDIKYNQFLDAKELNISLIDGDHFCTENIIIPELFKELSKVFADVEFIISTRHEQIVSFA